MKILEVLAGVFSGAIVMFILAVFTGVIKITTIPFSSITFLFYRGDGIYPFLFILTLTISAVGVSLWKRFKETKETRRVTDFLWRDIK